MMSPTAALTSRTVLTYVVLVGSLLPGIGLLLVLLTYGFGCRLGSVWRTYRSWLVMVPIVLAVLVAGAFFVALAAGRFRGAGAFPLLVTIFDLPQ